MNIADIVALAKAGYTAEQIGKMSALETAPEAKTEPETEVKTEAKTETKTETKPEAQKSETDPTLQAILSSIKDLTTSLQSNAILKSEQPPEKTAEDILAEIINPPIKPLK